jgi:LEA14-like dessication related protein
MKKRKEIFFILFFLFFAILCQQSVLLARALARKNIEVSLKEARISELSSQGLTLSFLTLVENNSSRKYALVSYQYLVLINEKEYFRQEVSLTEPIDIPAEDHTVINFPVRINYQYLEAFLSGSRTQARCRVSGEIYFQDERKKTEKAVLNFHTDFPVFRLPEIQLQPLLVRHLTLGGADFSFRFSLNNANNYDLLIQEIRVELVLENQTVFQGKLSGDKTLTAGESKTYILPLILDFFEQGRELRESLEKEATPFMIKLWIEADSAWGRLAFPVEKTGVVRKEFKR